MDAWSPLDWIALAAATFAVSASCTRVGIAYAVRRRLLDLPGQRRSHSEPTPRGGGIGIVVSAALAVILIALRATGYSRCVAWTLLAAMLVVAMVGWIDDHGGLKARTRFAAHCVAAACLLGSPLVVFGFLAPVPRPGAILLYGMTAVIPAFAIVWSINLHNFMDGIDGLLTCQALFVMIALAIIFAAVGQTEASGQVGLFAAAAVGFLPFNFPRAHIFMGDVGSGVLGLLVAVVVARQMIVPDIALCSGPVLCSAFVIDASCTLLSRMLHGRRWYSAHREHLYQWLVRCGRSHAQVVGLYMGWNLLIVTPAVYWMNRTPLAHEPSGFGTTAAVYLLGIVVWWTGKRWCLQRIRHAAA